MKRMRFSLPAALLVLSLSIIPSVGQTQSNSTAAANNSATTETAKKADDRGTVAKAIDKVKAVVKEKAKKFEVRTPSAGGAVRG